MCTYAFNLGAGIKLQPLDPRSSCTKLQAPAVLQGVYPARVARLSVLLLCSDAPKLPRRVLSNTRPESVIDFSKPKPDPTLSAPDVDNTPIWMASSASAANASWKSKVHAAKPALDSTLLRGSVKGSFDRYTFPHLAEGIYGGAASRRNNVSDGVQQSCPMCDDAIETAIWMASSGASPHGACLTLRTSFATMAGWRRRSTCGLETVLDYHTAPRATPGFS
ncbi:hypothetical protein K438DRAFT_1959235 [Mycena galopus ATCC 62051]|nr:hypothetical protein K438DRAFT_1959235 [Mycena galopus ATCC 62051]